MNKEVWIHNYALGIKHNREKYDSKLTRDVIKTMCYISVQRNSPVNGYWSARLAKAGVEPYELGN